MGGRDVDDGISVEVNVIGDWVNFSIGGVVASTVGDVLKEHPQRITISRITRIGIMRFIDLPRIKYKLTGVPTLLITSIPIFALIESKHKFISRFKQDSSWISTSIR